VQIRESHPMMIPTDRVKVSSRHKASFLPG